VCVKLLLSPVCLDLLCLLLVLPVRACVCGRETVCVAAAFCSVGLYVISLLLFVSACMCVCVRVCVLERERVCAAAALCSVCLCVICLLLVLPVSECVYMRVCVKERECVAAALCSVYV